MIVIGNGRHWAAGAARRVVWLLAAVCLLGTLPSCGAGEPFFTREQGGLTYACYGSDTGISRVQVTDAGTGKLLSDMKIAARRGQSEPYSPSDGQNDGDYGLWILDVDADGDDDAVVQTRRAEGFDKYDFWLNDGQGRFTRCDLLSALSGPEFGGGDGLVGVTTHTVSREPQLYPNSPEIYTETRLTVWYRPDENGIPRKTGGRALIYYSESDIYCLATYVPEKKNSDVLVPDTEKWIAPDRLGDYGLSPFEK